MSQGKPATTARALRLPPRALGRSGLYSSAIGMGCMGLDTGYGPVIDRSDGIKLLRHAVDCGITMFDTAELYGPFTNEQLVGKALRPVRESVLIATKFGARIVDGKPVGLDSRPDHIVDTADAALCRLGVDVIDIFYQHRVDPEVPIEDVAGAIQRLIEVGKVRAFGLSEPGEKTLRQAHAVEPVAAVQSEYSLWTRDPESNGVLAACEELGIGFVAFSPLGRGFLAGSAHREIDFDPADARISMPRFTPESMAANQPLVDAVSRAAKTAGLTQAQFALAWLLSRRPWVIPLVGTRTIARIKENAGAAKVRLDPSQLEAFDAHFETLPIAGARYPDHLLAMTGR